MNKLLTGTLKIIRIGDALPEEVLFLNVHGATYRSFWTSFKRAVCKANIAGLAFHDLRHMFASRLVMAGVDLPTVKELMGHKNINMMLRSTHLSSQHKQLEVDALQQFGEKVQSIFTTGAPSPAASHPQVVDFSSMPR